MSSKMAYKAKSGAADSLWTVALQWGWAHEEAEVLKTALMKFGIGKWKRILRSGVLPSKSLQQMYLQTQKILGQQSLVGFMGLHVDIDRIQQENAGKQGFRKHGILINKGGTMSFQQKYALIRSNQAKYGLPRSYYESLKLPKPSNIKIYNTDKILRSRRKFTTSEKLEHLKHIKSTLYERLEFVQDGNFILNFQNQTYAEYQKSISHGCMTAEQVRLIDEGSYVGSDMDEVDEAGVMLHRHKNLKDEQQEMDILEVRSSQRSTPNMPEQQIPASLQRISSSKVCPLFKGKLDDTKDPRSLPKPVKKRDYKTLEKRRFEALKAAERALRSQDEFFLDELPKQKIEKTGESERKLTRFQKQQIEKEIEETKDSNNLKIENKPSVNNSEDKFENNLIQAEEERRQKEEVIQKQAKINLRRILAQTRKMLRERFKNKKEFTIVIFKSDLVEPSQRHSSPVENFDDFSETTDDESIFEKMQKVTAEEKEDLEKERPDILYSQTNEVQNVLSSKTNSKSNSSESDSSSDSSQDLSSLKKYKNREIRIDPRLSSDTLFELKLSRRHLTSNSENNYNLKRLS